MNQKPARSPSLGRILNRELEARGWTRKDLADFMGCDRQNIDEIICGNKQITTDVAMELSQVLGTSPEFWKNLQDAIKQ
jgi:addiction module HigA family antidote